LPGGIGPLVALSDSRPVWQQPPSFSSFRRQVPFDVHGHMQDAGDDDELRLRIDVQDQLV
jgi:hypothetical protein